MRSKIIFLGLLLSACTLAPAQGIKSKLRQGNSLYKAKNFPEAETTYRKALLLDSLSGKANFGIAASAYEQGRYEESSRYLERALKDTRLTPAQASATLHNLGNVAMKAKKYEEAVRLYEESLIADPESDDTRYNLALAQRLLQQQQQKGGGGGGGQPDQNKQDKQPPKQKQEKDKDQQKQPPKQGNDKQGQALDQKDQQMTKEQAEQILNAFRSDDEATRQRVEQRLREEKQQRSRTKDKKRW